jgi:hypothetical protein
VVGKECYPFLSAHPFIALASTTVAPAAARDIHAPALRGDATPTATADTNTTAAPVISSRIESQRLTSWMGHQARFDSSMLAWGWG